MRNELLARELFNTFEEAKVLINHGQKEYNQIRPHSTSNYQPSAPEVVLTGTTREEEVVLLGAGQFYKFLSVLGYYQ